MAADKEIMRRIETLRLDRPGRMHKAAADTLEVQLVGEILISALRELAATYREEAELWSKSGARGWKSSETEAYLIAQAVDSVAAQLDNAGGGAALSVSDGVERKTAHDWNADPRVTLRVASWSDFGNSAHRLGMTFDRDDPITLAEFERARDSGTVTVYHVTGQTEAATTHERLDDLVSSAVAEGLGLLRDVAAGQTVSSATDLQPLDMGEALGVTPDQYAEGRLAGFAAAIEPGAIGDAIAAYLSGAVDTLPGLAEALVPGSIPRMSEADNPFDMSTADRVALASRVFDVPPHMIAPVSDAELHAAMPSFTLDGLVPDADTVPTTWESETMTADGHTKPGVAQNLTPTLAPALGQPGDMGAGYSHDYVPPGGRRVTFAELLTPVPVAILPPHVSNSQIDTAGDCLAKYRMQRVDQLPQIPQWANIGGATFHAAVESWERMAAQYPGISLNEEDVEGAWKHHFENTIAVVQMSTTVPISSWRAARKGAEGRAWWEVNGPLMLRRYLDARPSEPTFDVPVVGVGGIEQVSGIEAELTIDVPTNYGPVPFVAKLDRVTAGHVPGHPAIGALVIRDYKTSYERPTDTTQLGDYAWTLRSTLARCGGPLAEVPILGTFFDARRGEWTEPVDLLAAHPFESFQYRVTVAHAQKRALTTGPTPARPSSFCGGCSVRYACPIMASRS